MSDDPAPSEGGENEPGKADRLPAQKPKMSNHLFVFGVLLTAGWLIGVAAWWEWSLGSLRELEPNAFGDFLAGTFAPVAFLWLVLGFWQQGKELRNSADALWLQMEELRNSVDQQRDLVRATRDLRDTELRLHEARVAEERRIALPMLTITGAGGSSNGSDSYNFRYRLTNSGRPCNEVQVAVGNHVRRREARMESGQHTDFEIGGSLDQQDEHECRITWIDERNTPGSKRFRLTTGRERSVELLPD